MLREEIERVTEGVYPMHMPGHKRNPAFLHSMSLPDVTEITGTDDLHHAHGILRQAQERTAALFGVKRTFHLTGGSTCGILAAVCASAKQGETVLAARNCHKSVYHALFAGDLRAEYIYPAVHPITGVYGHISPEQAEKALADSGAKTVVLTSPTYEGIISDIRGIARAVHNAGALLIVDEAHGAHLGFGGGFPESARTLGADIVIESAHKTLPCVTGAAMLHICSDRAEESRIAQMLSVFETSSPPYPILYSLDNMTELLISRKDTLFSAYRKRLNRFYEKTEKLRRLRIYRGEGVFAHDAGKILILCGGTDMNGYALKRLLLEKYRIECETALPGSVLAMTSVADTDEGFDRLAEALTEADASLCEGAAAAVDYPTSAKTVMTIRRAMETVPDFIAADDAAGRVSAGFLYAYPPGSPLTVPGEIITEQAIRSASTLWEAGADVYTSSGSFPDRIPIISDYENRA